MPGREGQAGAEAPTVNEAPPESSPEWAALLGYLQVSRGFDFRGYKPASLARRVRKRMDTVGIDGFARYQDYLEVHPDEFASLFNTILINVTSFFRDPAAWDIVRELAIPQIISAKARGESIRVWSAGCATGEEAYTLAMVLSEQLGEDQFRERLKIYATDIDDDALNTARHAVFTDRQVESVPAELLDRYFEHGDGVHTFRKELRRQVIFGRHDLINDAPISRIDLLTCRNTLMYLNAETQTKVLNRLHFALNNGGFLLLGRAETLMAHGHSFVSVDLKRRLSRKTSHSLARDRHQSVASEGKGEPHADIDIRVTLVALEASPVAQILVNAAGEVSIINDRARALFDLRGGQVGRPLRDLQISYWPVELRSLIDRVDSERRPLCVKEIEWHPIGSPSRWLDVSIVPLADSVGALLGTLLTFSDVTGQRQLQRDLQHSHQELETAYEELQSTNEELETMNEELRSTNEELQTMNDELRRRGEDLNSANAFLESVLSSMRGGVAVVDREQKVVDRTADLHAAQRLSDDLLVRGQSARHAADASAAESRHVQKLESIGVLAGGIAHDFNNLLHVVLGNADIALSQLPQGQTAREPLEEVIRAPLRAADLTRQLLAYSGKGAFVIRHLDLSREVRDMATLLRTAISKQATLAWELAPDLPAVSADPTQMRQIVMNLITNASDALGEESGTITLRTGVIHSEELIRGGFGEPRRGEIGEAASGMYVYLEVADTGDGMSVDTLNRIFDPFFSTKFTGRGLGLAAVMGIVRAHKGLIRIRTEPGQGTSFRVLFPPVGQPVRQEEEPASTRSGWRGSGTILIVDDEDGVREVAERMLQEIGFSTLSAQDGRQALDLFKRPDTEITGVLLDVSMPRMGGQETLLRLRATHPDLPVIMMSGYTEQVVADQLGDSSPNTAFLQKPFVGEDLVTAFRRYVAAPG